MGNRRNFIKTGLTGAVAMNLLPAVNVFADPQKHYTPVKNGDLKLRFALISDGHYAEPNTEYDTFFGNMVGWLTKEHEQNHLDLIIINGDIVHNRPDLLPKVKQTYFDKLPVPYHTIPGNHDYADAALWKSVFGYEDKYTIDLGDIGFVLANTANTKGDYVCPDNAFLKASFESFKAKPIVFAILHIPPHQWTPEDKGIFLDCPETVELLHAYPNIKAVFHGHDHSQDSVKYTNKFPHFFDSHFGGSWGTDYKGYRIVEVNQNNQVFTYQVNASQNPKLNSNKL
jgi:3',5'-cyclic AMP phosphodiesterase CpdA